MEPSNSSLGSGATKRLRAGRVPVGTEDGHTAERHLEAGVQAQQANSDSESGVRSSKVG
jgi:hypothetical protein